MQVLITGAGGFLGRNLRERLRRFDFVQLDTFGRENTMEELERSLRSADVVYHLAGVNRPVQESGYEANETMMDAITALLRKQDRGPRMIYASTIQALANNPYGRSKKAAEDSLIRYAEETSAPVTVYRLPNLFGKWCRPHYNSVVATFCHQIARGLDIMVTDANKELELAYIDDVIDDFCSILTNIGEELPRFANVGPTYRITLGKLAETIRSFRQLRETSVLPDLGDPLTKYLYSTYLSYLERDDFAYGVKVFRDQRGSLFEVVKSEAAGQIFVSYSVKGVERGHHYHNTKVEKFCVIKGKAIVKFRHLFEDESFFYELSGDNPMILDIPPGYTHAIENQTDGELIVLFWANEMFNQQRPDTYFERV